MSDLHVFFPGAQDNRFCAHCGNTRLTHPNMAEEMITIDLSALKIDGKMVGKKSDAGKPRMDLISSIALIELAKVLEFGSHKYDAHNWRFGIKWSRVVGATLRHIFSWLGGQDKDEETGLSHLAHAFCCVMFLLEYEVTRKSFDDRYKETISG